MVNVMISGADKSGALFRISTFLNRKGYGLKGHEIIESGSGTKLLKVSLDLPQVDRDLLSAELRKIDPDFGVVNVAIDSKQGTQSPGELLKDMAERFPDIAPLVRAYAEAVGTKNRDQELFEAGKKIGAFHYEKEWSFGTPLKMPVALRRTLAPALEKFGKVDATDKGISMPNSPFYGSGGQPSCCAFLTGFMQGFLDAGPSTHNTRVQKAACRAKGDLQCSYNVNYEQ
ncbi:MAG: hypothetical protein WBO23_14125 [Burkholderiales bacterium]